MEFIYFSLPDGKYLVMNNLHSEGVFKRDTHSTPTLFPKGTEVENIYDKISSRPDIKAILAKTISV